MWLYEMISLFRAFCARVYLVSTGIAEISVSPGHITAASPMYHFAVNMDWKNAGRCSVLR